jgi:group II intron reverse transcriptase/maturase
MQGTPSPDTISTRRQRIATLAKQSPGTAFTSLAHHIDIEWLHEAYRRTRKDGATGVDGQSAGEYASNLEANLQSLLDRAKSGTYRAPPVRRVHIPKGDGKSTRPLGIPTFEDKVLQRAVAMVLEAVYEQDFLACSYGFRPGRSAHQALQATWKQAMGMTGGWVLDVDIRKFFDTFDRRVLLDLLQQRVRDGVLLRLVSKWLHAGVSEDGAVTHPDAGTPQGGVISPLLANVYLHEVLDVWFAREVVPRLKGRASLIRYADDFVIIFSSERDARRVLEVLPKRFARYGLALHPEKTRLVPFCRPDAPPDLGGEEGPGTFDFLGFTHYWARSRKGNWVVARKTAKSRLRRAIVTISQWCRRAMHLPVEEQHKTLSQELRGHYAYYGITGNARALYGLWMEVERRWRTWLHRRSQRARMTWARFRHLKQRFPLPRPVVVHSVYRLAANP